MVEWLKDCDRVNKDTLSYGRKTAYQLAFSLERTSIMEMLEKSGCDATSPFTSDYEDSDEDSDYDDSDDSNQIGSSSGDDE